MRGRSLTQVPWVGFSIGEAALAVEARLVKAVTWSRGLIQVPFTKKSVAGVIVRHGRIVPVLDLALAPALWNRLPRPGGSQIVIVGEGEMEAGILARETETFHSGEPRPGAAAAAAGRLRESLLDGVVEAPGRCYGALRVPAALQATGVPQAFTG